MQQNKWYWTFKHILVGPLLRVYNRPEIIGAHNIPATGGALLVSNHQAVMDSFYLPLLCPRQIVFPAKKEYFTTEGAVGKLQKWFFSSVGQIPIDRDAPDAMDKLLAAAKSVLDAGEVFGIYPEGTRSPDGRIYRGKTGMARIALSNEAPVVPVAMIGSRNANPIGSWVPRPAKVIIKVGEPIDARAWAAEQGFAPDSHEAVRGFTDKMMHTLAELAGQPYVDMYAADVKASLEAGKGYPEGAR
ncbi:1-acyl-sn-glycerol-3-phosphate acyltransferase [Corynebacterium sp. 153RC1]|uniref:lysophospholipid acyltransferase family protein n=1 Tax=unclassified Corynebacterium TaxID=2624378 RepID=UPI00211C164F|nr:MULTISPECIES: lysophospholipid acyltransferase family protein [unclassified Corynebacterium]MCQ9369823.1 1-acyl-sn-glycerol-3-phosphate acyltransferase [Corynebacterium sp. 35RC1]MCQ9352268.1 1-acyl-sn-glycerol-3-phosphate acyltransferase [Corynebacterium sp. 209RC1]MCQ9354342.1 1-acyl-sn-glycerol-3-phosphate acyltransferase [Corynebacterium sp. 1222RC1]MCQ9356624.1 1-acyl-sn-glycerol-3-phosphate acyltransferase [Corynebacterium sp. 122RC1]MCQ9359634.1 1-acyl-sn-glycerol-3-phosphate acyltra